MEKNKSLCFWRIASLLAAIVDLVTHFMVLSLISITLVFVIFAPFMYFDENVGKVRKIITTILIGLFLCIQLLFFVFAIMMIIGSALKDRHACFTLKIAYCWRIGQWILFFMAFPSLAILPWQAFVVQLIIRPLMIYIANNFIIELKKRTENNSEDTCKV